MYCLEVIHSINERAARKGRAPRQQSRDCSFNVTSRGIILHSASHRDTTFLSGLAADKFVARVKGLQQSAVNSIIESICSKSR